MPTLKTCTLSEDGAELAVVEHHLRARSVLAELRDVRDCPQHRASRVLQHGGHGVSRAGSQDVDGESRSRIPNLDAVIVGWPLPSGVLEKGSSWTTIKNNQSPINNH